MWNVRIRSSRHGLYLTSTPQESDTPWATRWDNYLHIFDPVSHLAATFLIWLTTSAFQRIHWFSLINSIIVVVFLCLMVSMILLRTVSRDVRPFNDLLLFSRSPCLPDFPIQRH